MDEQPIGPLLDNLGIVTDITPDQQITDVVVIAKVTDFADGTTAVGLYGSADWVTQLGLITAAQQIVTNADTVPDDDHGI